MQSVRFSEFFRRFDMECAISNERKVENKEHMMNKKRSTQEDLEQTDSTDSLNRKLSIYQSVE